MIPRLRTGDVTGIVLTLMTNGYDFEESRFAYVIDLESGFVPNAFGLFDAYWVRSKHECLIS